MTPDRDLECAEYVLGLLDTEERSAVERALHEDAALQAAVDAWEFRLSPLGEAVTPGNHLCACGGESRPIWGL